MKVVQELDDTMPKEQGGESRRACCLQMKGPPKAKKRYPGIYPSKGSVYAKEKNNAPIASRKLPSIPHNRGPK